jgi:hypothetical protein
MESKEKQKFQKLDRDYPFYFQYNILENSKLAPNGL